MTRRRIDDPEVPPPSKYGAGVDYTLQPAQELRRHLADACAAILADGPLTVAELARILATPAQHVRRVLLSERRFLIAAGRDPDAPHRWEVLPGDDLERRRTLTPWTDAEPRPPPLTPDQVDQAVAELRACVVAYRRGEG